MKITIDFDAYERIRDKLNLEDFVLLTLFHLGEEGDDYTHQVWLESTERLETLGFIREIDGKIVLTSKTRELLGKPEKYDLLAFDEFIEQYRNLFPTGKKNNQWYWRANKTDLTSKFEKFFKKYKKYKQEDVLRVTKKYIQSFNQGNIDNGMMLSHYFIEKNNTSMLLTCLENETTEDINTGRNITVG